MTLAAYLHNLDPFAIQFTENFGIRWYGLAYACAFLFAYLAGREMAKRGRIQMTVQQVGDFLMAGVIGVLVGGRLGYVLFYNLEAFWTFTSSPPWWEPLAINRGGMASHGGMVGAILGMLWFARRNHLSLPHIWDVAALLTPVGLGLGRLANFVNAELRGVPCDEDFPLAVKYPQEVAETWGPAQLERVSEIAGELGMTRAEWFETLAFGADGRLLHPEAFRELRLRIVEALQSHVQPVVDVVAPMLTPRHPSQLYQGFAEGVVLTAVLWTIWLVFRPKRAGVIGAAFMLTYGVLRIITEHWRIPDEGVERIMGLSRGQLLSVGMIVVGLVYSAWLVIRKPETPAPQEPNALTRTESDG